MPILAKISLHNKNLILESLVTREIKNKIYPAGGSKIGTTVFHTAENLGITKRAVPILHKLFENAKTDGGDLCDIDWFESIEFGFCFGWLGPLKRIINPIKIIYKSNNCQFSSAFLKKQYIELEN